MITLPHLETDVTQACQLSCVACNHAVPLWRKHGPWMAQPEMVYADLKHLATFAHAKVWAALGGEPLLNKRLLNIVQAARASGIADIYEVWTNGILLCNQTDEFWEAIDSVVVSRYPGKLRESDIEVSRDMAAKHNVAFHYRDERPGSGAENFMTFLEPTPTGPEVTQAKYTGCAFRRGNNYAASYGYFFMCCCGPHLPMLVQGREFGDDGIAIAGLTEDSLAAYIGRTEPLAACTDCAGRDTAKRIPWSEQRDPVIWLKSSAGL